MANSAAELAGQFQLAVRAFADKDLDDVAKAIEEAFAKFEKEGISEKDLNRIKAGQETHFYNSLSSVLGKGVQLAQCNIFAGDPGIVEKDIARTMAVTPADVTRVYDKYIKGKNYIATSFVPKGKIALAVDGSKEAEVVEEKIVRVPSRRRRAPPSESSSERHRPSTARSSRRMVRRPRSRYRPSGRASSRTGCACTGSRTPKCRWCSSRS